MYVGDFLSEVEKDLWSPQTDKIPENWTLLVNNIKRFLNKYIIFFW